MLRLPPISVLALPVAPIAGDVIRRGGKEFIPLAVTADEQTLPLVVSFETAADSLEELPRMFLEADGSFVWTGDQPFAWQVDGQLHDAGGNIRRVDLQGTLPESQFKQLLQIFGHSVRPLMFELRQEGIFLAEPELLAWIAASET